MQLNRFTKTSLIISLIFIVYGYLCRLLPIHFFWESNSFGWAILLLGLIGLLAHRISIKQTEEKKSLPEKIGIGLLVFILFVQAVLLIILPFSDAYAASKAFLFNNQQLQTQVGKIQGFGLIPSGSIKKTTDSSGEYGEATINLTVKGEKKYRDLTVYVQKQPHDEWEVIGIE